MRTSLLTTVIQSFEKQYVLYNYVIHIEKEKYPLIEFSIIHHIKNSWEKYEKIAKLSFDETCDFICLRD